MYVHSKKIYSPTKLQVLRLYCIRIFRWRLNSAPYISGDAIADLVDFVYQPPRFRSFRCQQIQISDANSIFVRGVDFKKFLREHSEKIEKTSMICIGNSDEEFAANDLKNLLPGCRFLIQNSFISDQEKIKTLPLGIENLRWGINGDKKLFKNKIPDSLKIRKVMFGPFSKTHPMRLKTIEFFKQNSGPWDIYEGYMAPKALAEVACRYRYVACLRGNGIDTHRIWETIYRGNFPIVKLDSWSNSLRDLKLPIIYVEEWNDELLSRALEEGEQMSPFNPEELEALWIPYWRDYILNIKRSTP